MLASPTLSATLRNTLEASTGKCAFGLFALSAGATEQSTCQSDELVFHELIDQLMRDGDQKVILNPGLIAVVLTHLVDVHHLTLASLKLGRLFGSTDKADPPKPSINAGLVYIGRHPGPCEHTDAIIESAASALKQSKDEGTTCEVTTFDDERIVDGHWEVNDRLASSIQHHHVSMDYVASYRLSDGQIIGVEALVRWRDRGEVIPPHEYMPALNDGTLMDLNIYCYRRVLREIVEFDIKVPVSINIAPACFFDPDFESFLAHEAALWGVQTCQLTLEIAATSDFANIEAVIDVLRRLSDAGFKISIDDFGSGYANLERVKGLPIDRLKLDRSLTCRLMDDEKIADIAERIVTFGKEVNIDVIAAGIEDGATMEQLQAWGCKAGHGPYMGLPQAIEDLNKVRDIHEAVVLI